MRRTGTAFSGRVSPGAARDGVTKSDSIIVKSSEIQNLSTKIGRKARWPRAGITPETWAPGVSEACILTIVKQSNNNTHSIIIIYIYIYIYREREKERGRENIHIHVNKEVGRQTNRSRRAPRQTRGSAQSSRARWTLGVPKACSACVTTSLATAHQRILDMLSNTGRSEDHPRHQARQTFHQTPASEKASRSDHRAALCLYVVAFGCLLTKSPCYPTCPPGNMKASPPDPLRGLTWAGREGRADPARCR